jgi:general nucleoside transport system permease protein
MIASLVKRIHFLEKRRETVESPGIQILLVLGAVLFAFAIGSLFFIPFGINPFDAYGTMLSKAFGDMNGLSFTIVRATPLILVGLGTIISWRSSFTYVGFEGAMLIGAISGIWFALNCKEGGIFGTLPWFVFFPLVLLFSWCVAGFWASIVGFCKVRLKGNEVIMSLMSNYIAILLINYLDSGPMRAPGVAPQTAAIAEYQHLPIIIPGTRIHAGVLVMLVLIVLIFILLNKTRLGYELIMTGSNNRAARYSGIKIEQKVLISAFLAGGLAGIAGIIEVLGFQFRVMDGITLGMGFTGIVTALLGRLNPFGLGLAAFLYAGMNVGSEAMQRASGIPTSIASSIQGLIILTLFVFDIFRKYKLVLPFHIPFKKNNRLNIPQEGGVSE